MNLVPFAVGWCILAVSVVVLIIYRRSAAGAEDDTLHVEDPTGAIGARQQKLARKLDRLDRWGKILTIVAVVYGVALAAGYLYIAWNTAATYSG